jgi:UDP-N-acetylmuramate--alanine ligase
MAQNATAAFAAAVIAGVDPAVAADGLNGFAGVERRFDLRGSVAGVTLVDDYAHLPTEIRATLAAARGSMRADGWQRIVAVFQPNRPNRMVLLSPEYRDAFVDADVLVVADVYPSGEAPIDGVTGELVVDAVQAAHPEAGGLRAPAQRARRAVAPLLRAGDVCISMGCGDVATLPDEVAPLLAGRPT